MQLNYIATSKLQLIDIATSKLQLIDIAVFCDCNYLPIIMHQHPKQHNSSPDKLNLTPPHLRPTRHPHSAPLH